MRDEIAKDYARPALRTQWDANAHPTPEELTRLADVKRAVEALLRTQEWRDQEATWRSHPR